MDKRENEDGLIRNSMWLATCLKMDLWRHEMVHPDLVYFTKQLVLVLSTKQEQPKAMKWSAIHLDFSYLGGKLNLSHGIGFHDLRHFHTKVDFHFGLGMLHNMLQGNRDQIGMNWILGDSICTFWMTWYDFGIMAIFNFWTKTKWNWLMCFAWNLCQMFLAMSLIIYKKNQVKRICSLQMAMW